MARNRKRYVLKVTGGRGGIPRVNYEKALNPQQLQVVTAGEGPLLVIAGAGSGKTRVVTYRVAYLIESGVDPRRILLATFTNKAAREMLHRVELLLNSDLQGLWGGTFHHVANLILRREGKLLGYQPNYTILDRGDARSFIEFCVQEVGIDTRKRRFPKGDVLINLLSFSLNSRLDLEKAINLKYPHLLDFLPEMVRVFERYKVRKKEMNCMDFDDLLTNLLLVLSEHPQVKEYYTRRFQHILVDEYQDTNLLQAEIVDLLASYHRNLMVVGDDSQSIYSFRGAHFKNIIEFPKRYPETQFFSIEINYRSTPEILNLANWVVKGARQHFPKELKAVSQSGSLPVLVATSDVYQQASFVAQRILEHREEGVPLGDIAVLYRAHYHSMELQMELIRRGIPFIVRSGLRFFEQAHIKDILSHLKVIYNPYDELSWKRILRLLPGIGTKMAQKIWSHISSTSQPLEAIFSKGMENFLSPRAQEGWKKFVNLMRILQREASNPSQGIKRVLEGGYEEHLRLTYTDYSSRLEDANQLLNYALQYESLERFLTELSFLGGLSGEEIFGGDEREEMVILSTAHQAKGLEWKVVFIISLVEGCFPSSRDLESEESIEEARRLFYVATTRAKQQLYLIYPLTRTNRDWGGIIMKPSRFLSDIPSDAYEEWVIDNGCKLRDRWE